MPFIHWSICSLINHHPIIYLSTIINIFVKVLQFRLVNTSNVLNHKNIYHSNSQIIYINILKYELQFIPLKFGIIFSFLFKVSKFELIFLRLLIVYILYLYYYLRSFHCLDFSFFS